MRRIRFAAPVVAALLVGASCGGGGGEAPLPASPPVAVVTMREYRFDHGKIQGGRVVFQAPNAGQVAHRLSLIPMPDDMPPIQDQLRGGERQVVFTLASVPDTPPGETGTFAVDLTPGRYAMVCFITEADGTSHASQGMATEFKIA